MKIFTHLISIFLILICIGCAGSGIEYSSYNKFYGTKAWDLVNAIDSGDTTKIGEILKQDASLINYQDSTGWSILMHVVYNQLRVRFPYTFLVDFEYGGNPEDNPQNMIVFQYLLKKGADVNIKSNIGRTALTLACGLKRGDKNYVKLLLENGADIKAEEVDPAEEHIHGPYTPLMCAVQSEREDYVDLLLEYGADINYSNECGSRALSEAMWQPHKLRGYSMVLYLLKHGADYTIPYRKYGISNSEYKAGYKDDDIRMITFVQDLRDKREKLGSEEYRQKMVIVYFLKKRGIDYKKVPIPEDVIEYAKEEYPKTWREYLEKY